MWSPKSPCKLHFCIHRKQNSYRTHISPILYIRLSRPPMPLHWGLPRFCDVSLPVPLDQTFTYSLPLTLQHRVRPGARVIVPFGTRKMTGVVLATHDTKPGMPVKDAFRLIDPEPVLDVELIALGRWISGYYCSPLGEVLRSMLPLSAEIRSGKVYSLTDAGRDASKQLFDRCFGRGRVPEGDCDAGRAAAFGASDYAQSSAGR